MNSRTKRVYDFEKKVKKCSKCSKWKPFTEFSKDKYKRYGITVSCLSCRDEYTVKYSAAHREELNARARRYTMLNRKKHRISVRSCRAKLRQKCVTLLGAYCAFCGNSDYRVLEIDHINGGGNRHRKNGAMGRYEAYKDVLKHPKKYRVLCANCHRIRHFKL